jgi:hypothetical protein
VVLLWFEARREVEVAPLKLGGLPFSFFRQLYNQTSSISDTLMVKCPTFSRYLQMKLFVL